MSPRRRGPNPLARLAGLAVVIHPDLSAALVVDQIPPARLAGWPWAESPGPVGGVGRRRNGVGLLR